MQEIKNIIFDLGGVIINLDLPATRSAFMQLGVRDFDAVYTQANQTDLFDAFEKGEITPHEFREALRRHIPREVSDHEIDTAWNAMLLDVPGEKLELLEQLRKNYRLFLLSNTNVIHVAAFSAELQRVHGASNFSPYFEQWYYSCNIGMRKPDAEIFEFVLEENNLKAGETLFIDDSAQHIRGADKLGIQTLLLDKNVSLHDALNQMGIAIS